MAIFCGITVYSHAFWSRLIEFDPEVPNTYEERGGTSQEYLSRVERPQHDSPRITYVHTMCSYSPQRRRWVVYTSSLDQGISYVFALEVRTWTVQFEKIVFRNFRTSYMFSHKTDNNCIDRDSDVTQRQAAIFPCVIENGNFPHLWSSIRHVEWV